MNWEPCRSDHSIARATASATFINPYDSNALDDLIAAGRKIASDHKLTGRLDQFEPVELEPGKTHLIQVGGGLEGQSLGRRVLFRRLDSEGVAVDEISIAGRRIAVGTLRYNRWQDLFRLMSDLITGLHENAPILDNLQTVQLEYIDRFTSPPGGGDHFEVISRNSVFLPDGVKEKQNAMHVHMGWFDFEEASIRKLTNINIDVRDRSNDAPPEAGRTLSIRTMGRFESLDGPINEPVERLDELHRYLKATFGDLITAEAAQRVALGKE